MKWYNYVTRKKGIALKDKTNFVGRSYRQYSEELFKDNLRKLNWDTPDLETDPDRACESNISKYYLLLDNMCPLKTLKNALKMHE